jgi:hypothetical protein
VAVLLVPQMAVTAITAWQILAVAVVLHGLTLQLPGALAVAVQESSSSAGLRQLHQSSQDLHLTRSQREWLKHLLFRVHQFLHLHVDIDGKSLPIPEQRGSMQQREPGLLLRVT